MPSVRQTRVHGHDEHQVEVGENLLAHRCGSSRVDSHNVGHEMSVHYVHVDAVGPGPLGLEHLLTEARKIRSENGRRQLHVFLRSPSRGLGPLHFSVAADEAVGRTVMAELRLGEVLQFRDDALGEDLAKFHSPLVE